MGYTPSITQIKYEREEELLQYVTHRSLWTI
jgi:hypothetical protein